MTNYTEVNAILEIAAHANGKDYERLAKALGAIRGAIIDGCPVVAVHHSHEDPTKVAGFGHDYRCEREHVCRLQDYGVLRYFNLRITVEGEIGRSALCDYKLSQTAELHVCGIHGPSPAGSNELREVSA
jgi:hypothetical protein